jgi:hypothetical protein
MNKSIKIIKLDINELDDLSGVDAISIVSEPAIEENFMFFSKTQPHMFESYSDYPDGVSNNASRGIELNEKVNNKCATQVGKVRAQQLAQKEPISVDTIKRMYSYLSRAEEYYDENDNTACGTISYLLWGGLAAKRWSEAKLKELGLFQGDVDVSTLVDYVNEPSGSLIVKDVYNTIEEDIEMVDGIVELILKIEDLENRKEIVIDTLRDFAEEGVQFDLDLFLQRVGVNLFDEFAEVGPRGGESEDDFLGRCIPKLLSEGYDQEQAAAICYSSYRERYEEDKRTIQTYVQRLFALLGELDGLPVFASPTEAAEVAKIAGCEGYHEHQVGSYIVYMPCNEHDPSLDKVLNDAYEEWLKGQEKSWDNLSPEEQSELLKQLEQMGEEDVIFKREFINTSAIRSAAKPDEVSFMDSPNTRIRYKYVGPRDSKNRDFCRFLLDIDKVYRKEDINNMSLAGPNTGFGPGPKNNFYNIFLYKGGKYCRHNWEVITQFFEPKFDKWGRYETTDVQKPFDLLTNPASGLALIGGQVVNPSDIVTSRFSRQEFQDQQIIAGPLMIPDKLIERYDEKDGKYYVYFSEETIKKIAYKFMQKKYTDSTNIEHDSNKTFDDVFVVESWIVADPKRDKSLIYSGGKEYAKGTWYGMMKVKNNLLWNDYIKSGELKGFSVEGFFLDELLNKQSGNFQ